MTEPNPSNVWCAEMQRNVEKVWCSPGLLAVLTLSAALGISNPAEANPTDVVGVSSVHSVTPTPSPDWAIAQLDPEMVEPSSADAGSTEPETVLYSEISRSSQEASAHRQQRIAARTTEFPVEPEAVDAEPVDAETTSQSEDSRLSAESTPSPAPVVQVAQLSAPHSPGFDTLAVQMAQLSTAQSEAIAQVPTTPADTGADADTADEPRVLVAEVVVEGVGADLQSVVYNAIQTRPGRTATRSQLQDDINAIYATGLFANVRAVPQDTVLGVRVTFQVEANPVLQGVRIEGSQIVPQAQLDSFFQDQYGQILNLNDFQLGVEDLNQWYQDQGYILAQVTNVNQVSDDGIVTLQVAEGVVENIEVQFLNEDGLPTDEDGNPVEGKTREYIITRELETQPGDVFNQAEVEADLQRVYGLGIFDDVRIALNPGDDPNKVDVILQVIERSTGSVAAGLGFSSSNGVFGTISYQERNLGGNNQRLNTEVQLGERVILFDVGFTDPWIGGDPYRTSYTANLFARQSISLIFDGGDREVTLPDEDNPNSIDDGDRPRVQRIGGGLRFSRPLDEWLGWDNWRGTVGFEYQQVSIRDSNNNLSPVDALGNDLSFSGTGTDDLFSVSLGLVQDLRDDPLQPTSGSILRISSEQYFPFGRGSILGNRLQGSYTRYFPVDFTNFADGSEALAINLQAGTFLGDLPPYEAFSLGGGDTVRGYGSGDVGSGRSYFLATAEYRFPLISVLSGALFLDYGTDLGTGDNVPGQPAEIRDKPGSGFGYGFGIRVQSPLGPIRIDYGFSDQGDSRFHFGIGERF
jgi:outer membrane protein insertion porin family